MSAKTRIAAIVLTLGALFGSGAATAATAAIASAAPAASASHVTPADTWTR
jgi:hypothetical protein